MPCCMAEKYNNWCNNYPLVDYKDEQGNQYCVFHAPQGKKDNELKQFNGLVFKRIYEHRESNCDFPGTVFEGDIEFPNLSIVNDVNFNDAVFNGETSFPNTTFRGKADFSKALFKKKTVFKETEFKKTANFGSAHFCGLVDFMHANYRDSAIFSEAIFDENIALMNAFFAGSFLCTNVLFKGEALVQHAKFDHYTNFYGSHFYKNAHFGWAKFSGLTWFNEAIFDKVAAFDNSKISGELECIQTAFNGRVIFIRTEFKSKSYFGDCKFRDSVNFDQAWFNDKASFKGNTFEEACSFQRLNITTKMRLEGVNCKQISFLDTDVRQIDFVNCNWLKAGRRDILFDEQKLMSKKEEQTPAAFKKVESLYRKLKQKYKEEHNEAEVSNWHYGEKEIFRKSNRWRRYLPSLTTLYWLFSGYGERPVKAGGMLLLFIIVFTMVLYCGGLSIPQGMPDVHGITDKNLHAWPNLKTGLASFLNTLQYVTFQKDPFFKPENLIAEFIKMLAQILIPIQTALFALAVRNRFRR